MRINGQFEGHLNHAITRKVTAESAKQAGICIVTDELQKAMDEFRLSRGLQRRQDTENWLASRGLSPDDLEFHLETDLLIEKFKDALEKEANMAGCSVSSGGGSATREVVYSVWLAELFDRCGEERSKK